MDMLWGEITQIGQPSVLVVKYQSENVRLRRKTVRLAYAEKDQCRKKGPTEFFRFGPFLPC